MTFTKFKYLNFIVYETETEVLKGANQAPTTFANTCIYYQTWGKSVRPQGSSNLFRTKIDINVGFTWKQIYCHAFTS